MWTRCGCDLRRVLSVFDPEIVENDIILGFLLVCETVYSLRECRHRLEILVIHPEELSDGLKTDCV